MTTPTYNATGGRNEWATPRDFLEAARLALGLPPIELDCAALAHTAVAPAYYGPDHEVPHRRDALESDLLDDVVVKWAVPGTRYLNPPYSRMCLDCPDGVWRKRKGGRKGCADRSHTARTVDDWMEAAARAGQDRDSGPMLALPAFRPATRWFQRHVYGVASRVLLVSSRLRFLEPQPDGSLAPAKTGAPFPSVLIEYVPPPAGCRWVTQFGRIGRDGSEADVPPRAYAGIDDGTWQLQLRSAIERVELGAYERRRAQRAA